MAPRKIAIFTVVLRNSSMTYEYQFSSILAVSPEQYYSSSAASCNSVSTASAFQLPGIQ